MIRLTKAEEYRESFNGLEVDELMKILESDVSKDLLYSLRALYKKKDLEDSCFEGIKRVSEEGPTAGIRKMGLNVIRRFFSSRINELDVRGKVLSGWVYFFLNERNGLVKIGFTTNIRKRLERLSKIEASELVELNSIKTSNYSVLESRLHKRFDKYRSKGEWFDFPEKVRAQIINNEIL